MAGTATFLRSDSTNKSRLEYWSILTDGSEVPVATIYTSLSTVEVITWAWMEDIGATAVVPEFTIDNAAKTVTILLSNATDIDKTMTVTLVGT